MKFFVSYSRSVQDKVREIISSMRDDGDEVWWDQDLRAGQDWWGTILNNIEACDVCLFMISEKSVQSPYCMDELRYALARNRLVLPYVIDGPVSYTIPPEIMKGRIQYEVYSGTPNHLKQRIRTTCKGITWDHYKDRYAARPPEPNTGTSDLALRTAKAIALAQEGLFDAAVEGFNDVAHNDFATYGEFCHQWIEKINRYKEIARLSTDLSMKNLAQPKWEEFFKLYRDDAPFDPLDIQRNFSQQINTDLVSFDSRHVEKLLENAIHIEDWDKRNRLVEQITDIGLSAVPSLLDAFNGDSKEVKRIAAYALAELKAQQAVEPLIALLSDKDEELRKVASGSLAKLKDERAVGPLVELLDKSSESLKASIAWDLGSLGSKRAIIPLISLLENDDSDHVKYTAAIALGEIGDLRALKPLQAALWDSSWEVRAYSALSLGKLGDQSVIEPLLESLLYHGNYGFVKHCIISALCTLKAEQAILILFFEYIMASPADQDMMIVSLRTIGSLKAKFWLIVASIIRWPIMSIRYYFIK